MSLKKIFITSTLLLCGAAVYFIIQLASILTPENNRRDELRIIIFEYKNDYNFCTHLHHKKLEGIVLSHAYNNGKGTLDTIKVKILPNSDSTFHTNFEINNYNVQESIKVKNDTLIWIIYSKNIDAKLIIGDTMKVTHQSDLISFKTVNGTQLIPLSKQLRMNNSCSKLNSLDLQQTFTELQQLEEKSNYKRPIPKNDESYQFFMKHLKNQTH